MTPKDVYEHASRIEQSIDDETAAEFATQFVAQDGLLEPLADLDPEPASKREWWTPDNSNDEYGAYLTQCDIQETTDSLLADTAVAVKDNIAVAGIPMTCGSPLISDFIPPEDATVVSRLLNAGATIIGKTNMDEFAFGGDESTMRLKLARNPNDPAYQPGSSSAGSGVAVAEGSVEAALGSDTGGSIRFPAAWCGIVGVKPTRGLVSHHGFIQFAKTLDNVGILAHDVKTAAAVLEVIAGEDSHDERTFGMTADNYRIPVENPPTDLTIGLPEELFGAAPKLDAQARHTVDELVDAGATVREISIQDFEYAMSAWLAIGMSEVAAYIDSRGVNHWLLSDAHPNFTSALAAALDKDDDVFGDPILAARIYAEHLRQDRPADLARAQRARQRVTAGVDDALADVDVLASTTIPMLPPKWGDGIDDVFGALQNTGPFNVSGHPAVSVPCGTVDGLPVGLQFIADRGADATALAAAARYEALRGESLSPRN